MDTIHNGKVITLRSGALDRAEARAREALYDLMAEADDALEAVCSGDVDSVFQLHRLVNQAIGIVLDNRLRTTA